MYVYHCLIYLRYRKPVASLAILADDSRSWRPQQESLYTLGKHRIPVLSRSQAPRLRKPMGDLGAKYQPLCGYGDGASQDNGNAPKPPAAVGLKNSGSLVAFGNRIQPKGDSQLRLVYWMMRLPQDL